MLINEEVCSTEEALKMQKEGRGQNNWGKPNRKENVSSVFK